MRILACGGRHLTDPEPIWRALDHLHEQRGITLLIHGAAPGADTLAAAWAAERRLMVMPFPADWSLGPAGGPIRNGQMLRQGMPDGVVAFPGGRGTADMVRQAEAAGVRVWRPYG